MSSTDLAALNRRYGISDTARFEAGEGDLIRLVMTTHDAEAVIYLYGAQVTHYCPAGEDPVLWMSGRSWFEAGKPIRGGIPVCFPWFGPHPTDSDLPAHGLARLREWAVESVTSSDAGVTVTLSLHEGSVADLTLVVEIGSELGVILSAANSGPSALTFTEALHSYFTVSDIRQARLYGLEACPYTEKAAGASRRGRDDGPIEFTGEIDRPYLQTRADCVLEDPGLGRRIRVVKTGSNSTVVWNPWTDKSRAMPDFGDDEWQSMVCIETANALEDAVTLNPGQAHRMSTVISVERM